MRTTHLDVDESISRYLNGQKSNQSITEYKAAGEECLTIKSSSKVTEETLKKFPKLKLIVTRTVGIDHIKLEECKARQIAVYHIEDYGAFNIAEHTFALLLAGTRNIVNSYTEVKKGIFSYIKWQGITLKDKTIGVIGTGKIGLEVIRLSKAFGMKVVAFDVFRNEKASEELDFKYVSLNNLLKIAHVITLHAPLLESTKHIIDELAIKKMKEGVVLINTARGALIDTEALLKYEDKFSFIGLDVVEFEDKFTSSNRLLKSQKVIITPHIGFFSDASVVNIARQTNNLIVSYIKGDESGRVV